MSRKYWKCVLCLPALGVLYADLYADDTASASPPPAWSTKQSATWTPEDAKQVLTDSPWAKPIMPSVIRGSQNNGNGPRSGGGRRGGFGFPGGGVGFPGGGGGYPGGGGGRRNPYPNNAPPANDDSASTSDREQTPPKLTLRWESALPIRAAELKAHDENAPTLEDENHYALAVYGIPANMMNGDLKQIADEAKKKASLSRDNKKDMKPTSVQILRREDGPVVLFLFQRPKNAKEGINKDDHRVEFDAQIGKLSVSQAFYLEDMTFQGKTEL